MIGAQIPVTGQVDLLEMQPSYGDFIGASLEMGWMRNPVPSWLRYMDREEARGKDTLDYMHDPGIQSLYRTLGLTGKRDPNDLSPMVPKSQLNEIYGRIGLNFKNDERVEVAAMIATQKERENRLQELQKRAESKRTYGTGFLAEMAAGIADPLNIASAFIPVVGQARYASMLARYGATTARAARGLVEGAAGAALVEPLVLLGATDEQADYTAMDSLLNVAFGGVLGGGLHTGLGAIKDLRAARTGRLSEAQTAQVLDFVERERAKREPAPQNEVAQQFDAMPVADKENLMRATVAQMEEGRSVTVGELHWSLRQKLMGTTAITQTIPGGYDRVGIDADLQKKMFALEAERDAIASGTDAAKLEELRAAMAAADSTQRRTELRAQVAEQKKLVDNTKARLALVDADLKKVRDTLASQSNEARASADAADAQFRAGQDIDRALTRLPEVERQLLQTQSRGELERLRGERDQLRALIGDMQPKGPRALDVEAGLKASFDGFVARANDPIEIRTADFEAAKDASAKLETTKAPTDVEREIADLESEIADIATRTKPLQENLGIKDDLLKAADDAIKQAKSEAQAYQIAAACKLGL